MRSALPSSLARNSLLPRFNLTGSALLDAPFSDGGRAGTKPNGFELQLPRPRPFRKGSPARREGSQTTMRARPCPTSVRIRELSYSSSWDPSRRLPFNRDRFWTSTAALARAVYCGRPLPASREAGPWFSGVHVQVFAIGSCPLCGEAGGGIKPPMELANSLRVPSSDIVRLV